jgi:hypothetical protein
VDSWGLILLAAGALLILLGITGRAESVLNGARVKSGNPAKAAA